MSEQFKRKFLANASWIIVCKVIQAIMNFVINMLSARYLGPSNYGLITYAASTIAFFTPLVDLGFSGILVKKIVEEPDKEGLILGSSMVMSAISSVLCIIASVLVVFFINRGEMDTLIVMAIYSTILLFQGMELIQFWFQAKLKSKYVSIVTLAAYLIVSAYKMVLLITKQSVYMFALAYSIDHVIISFSLLYFYKKQKGGAIGFSLNVLKDTLRESRHFIVPAIMVTVFTQTDRFMLKMMIDNAATGLYSAAESCAGVASFIVNAIVESARPVIFDSHKSSKEAFEKNVRLLFSTVIYFCLLQSIATVIFSRLLISVIYGEAYLAAIPVLRIVTWFCIFATIGTVRNIWMVAEGLQRYLLPINLFGGLINILLNLILIRNFGVEGAAMATLITQGVTNVVFGWIIKPIRRNCELMIMSLNPIPLLRIVRSSALEILKKGKTNGHNE